MVATVAVFFKKNESTGVYNKKHEKLFNVVMITKFRATILKTFV